MLKKIVKYGNSSALVLDKALLELLNMAEGSVVKIKTDGVSLIITPQTPPVQESVSPTLTPEDVSNEAVVQVLDQYYGGDRQKVHAYRKELKEIYDRYIKRINQKMNTPETRQALATIQKRFAGDEANPEYGKALTALNRQSAPEINQMSQEMNDLVKKQPFTNSPHWEADQFPLLTTEFKKVHQKYSHLLLAVAKLNENPEYMHETMLLAEKYKATQNPQEYFAACAQLNAQYIPEFRTYQEELKKVVEKMSPTDKTKDPA